MSESRKLGDIMKDYLLKSDDDYAVAFSQLYKEHGGDLVKDLNEQEDNKNGD